MVSVRARKLSKPALVSLGICVGSFLIAVFIIMLRPPCEGDSECTFEQLNFVFYYRLRSHQRPMALFFCGYCIIVGLILARRWIWNRSI